MDDIYLKLREKHRTVILGTGSDDGSDVTTHGIYHFTVDDVAITVSRFMEAIGESEVEPTVLVSADDLSMPLVLSLSRLMDCDIGQADDVENGENVLVVQALLATKDPLAQVMRKVKASAGTVTTFSLQMVFPGVTDNNLVPSFLGIVSKGATLPWQHINKKTTKAKSPSGLTPLLGIGSYLDMRTPSDIADDITGRVNVIQGVSEN